MCRFRALIPLSKLVPVAMLVPLMLAGCGGTSSQDSTDAPTVSVESGQLRGIAADGYRMYAGIPYAAVPAGELRWKAPAPAAAWPGVRDATKPGPACEQAGVALMVNPGHLLPYLPEHKSEDCLSVNVWTPASGATGLPVLVYIHGGAFIGGTGANYAPVKLVTRGNLIAVTINYRLASYGFLAHPALAEDGRVGNYGLLDQQAALKWVQRNIAAFGGDPAKVTIAGGSAGGMSVCAHLAAASSAGLFRSAIIQSGPCRAIPATHATQAGTEYAAKLGCAQPADDAVAACLRGLPADKLTKPEMTDWVLGGVVPAAAPVGDGTLLPPSPTMPPPTAQLLAGGPASKVPVLIGSNHDEASSAVMIATLGTITDAQYHDKLRQGYGNRADTVAAQYPPAKYGGDPAAALGAAATDAVFACDARAARRAIAPHAPVFAYELSDPDAALPSIAKAKLGKDQKIGSFHGAEIGLLFDTADRTLTPAQQQLSDQMVRYFAAFVTTSDPNTTGQTTWPPYDPDTDTVFTLKPDGNTLTDLFATEHQCTFWDSDQ